MNYTALDTLRAKHLRAMMRAHAIDYRAGKISDCAYERVHCGDYLKLAIKYRNMALEREKMIKEEKP